HPALRHGRARRADLAVVATRLHAPAEDVLVELLGLVHAARGELEPARGAVLAHDRGALVDLGLPDRERRAGRILADGHAPHVHHVERTLLDLAAVLLDLLASRVRARHGDVGHPVRRNAGLQELGRHLVQARQVLALRLAHRIDAELAGRLVLVLPAEQLAVERLGLSRVDGADFGPAERAGYVTLDLGHRALLLVSLFLVWLGPVLRRPW